MTFEDLEEWMNERDASAMILRGAGGAFTVVVYAADVPGSHESGTSVELAEAARMATAAWDEMYLDEDGGEEVVDAGSVPPENEEP